MIENISMWLCVFISFSLWLKILENVNSRLYCTSLDELDERKSLYLCTKMDGELCILYFELKVNMFVNILVCHLWLPRSYKKCRSDPSLKKYAEFCWLIIRSVYIRSTKISFNLWLEISENINFGPFRNSLPSGPSEVRIVFMQQNGWWPMYIIL